MTADVRARSPQSPQIRGQRASEDELVSLELILARNLVSTLHLAAVLLDETQTIVFYNPPAAALMGTNFEDTGPIPVESWRDTYGPLGPGGERIPAERLPITSVLRRGEPGHATVRLQIPGRGPSDFEVSGLPLVGEGGYSEALVIFWKAGS